MRLIPKYLICLLINAICGFSGLYAQCTEFYGTASAGGISDAGVLFKTDGNGENFSTLFNFITDGGIYPQSGFCESDDGFLYGVTSKGGIHGDGTLFKWDPAANVVVKLFDFDGADSGSDPGGALMQADNGLLFGTTASGGAFNLGIIYTWDPKSETFTKVFDFNGDDGAYPVGSLVQCYNGKLYGMTRDGGASDIGVIFEWDPAAYEFTKKYDLDYVTGCLPLGSLVQSDSGKLYGITGSGGKYFQGTIIEWDPKNNRFANKYNFDGKHGAYPEGSLLKTSNGKMFGVTVTGGLKNLGVLFEWNPEKNTYTKKADFTKLSPYPRGTLIEANNGRFYGMCWDGGEIQPGNVFLYEWDSTDNVINLKISLKPDNGAGQVSSLIKTRIGKIYGMTRYGGKADQGVIFEWEPDFGKYIKKLDFTEAINGQFPYGSLVQDNLGKLYGMTWGGGEYNKGIIFTWDPVSQSFTKKMDFNGDNGQNPYGSFLKAVNGRLYGMTSYGGRYGNGVLFEWNAGENAYTKLYDFKEGISPIGSLLEADNGKLYGMSKWGGANGAGTLFEWNIESRTFTNKFDFTSDVTGYGPFGSLIQAENGKLYGMTHEGGLYGVGVLFEWDPESGIFNKLVDFDGPQYGRYPEGSLLQADNGKIYGMTASGGIHDAGVIFEWDILSGIYTKKVDFNNTDGNYPLGALIKAENGKLYGLTESGGDFLYGVLFEFDPESISYVKKINFDGVIMGGNPQENLIEIQRSVKKTIIVQACKDYLSPSGLYTYNTSGVYQDTLLNLHGCDSIIIIQLTVQHVDTMVTQDGYNLTADAADAGFQWINCDNLTPVPGETGRTFISESGGTFAVIIDQNGCSDTSSCFAIIPNGLVESTFGDIIVFPNPGDGFFIVNLPREYDDVNVRISTPQGKVIQNSRYDHVKTFSMDINAPSGIYLVTITTVKEHAVFRVVKW